MNPGTIISPPARAARGTHPAHPARAAHHAAHRAAPDRAGAALR
ncbi:hypothetical protein ACWGB8_10715 [Kitasatospora sp. NPDC054939]